MDMQPIFLLIMLYYNGGADSGNYMATVEFTSQERCEIAGKAVRKEFGSRFYYVCAQK